MNNLRISDVVVQNGRSANHGYTEAALAEPLEVNVIFTGLDETAAALQSAASFARELAARIRVHAAIVVPFALPLDRPAVSVDFLRGKLRHLVAGLGPDDVEMTVHVYICRDPFETFERVLNPHSVVVLGTWNRWRPRAARGVAKALRESGFRFVLVETRQIRRLPLARGKQDGRTNQTYPPDERIIQKDYAV